MAQLRKTRSKQRSKTPRTYGKACAAIYNDAMSQLLLTVLSGVAEFERAIIRDRVVEGQRRAKAAGKHIGHPFAPGPTPAAVRKLRARGKSWSQVAKALGCTVATARRRAVA